MHNVLLDAKMTERSNQHDNRSSVISFMRGKKRERGREQAKTGNQLMSK